MSNEILLTSLSMLAFTVACCTAYAVCRPQSHAQERVVLAISAIVIILGLWQAGQAMLAVFRIGGWL